MRNGLPKDWQTVKLEDLCERITVGHVGPMADKYVEAGIPFLRSQNIQPFRLDMSDVKYIDDDFHRQLKKSAIEPGDVVVVRTGYPGTACVVPYKLSVANCADLVIIKPSKDLDSWFLATIFNSSWGRGTVAGKLVGVAQQHFNIGAARQMKIHKPPLATQRKIAGVLGAYDELIENNRRRIEILEEMARRLYREWFVQFRFPGHAHVPLTDSPLGKIPKGWEVKTPDKLLSDHIGGGWGQEEPDEKHSDAAYVIRGTDIPETRRLDIAFCPRRYHAPSNLRSRKLNAGDIVIEVSGGGKDQAVGRSLLVNSVLLSRFDGDVICASFCKRVQVDAGAISPLLFWLHLNEIYDDGRIKQYQVQSTGIKNFQFAVFLEKEQFVVPPRPLQTRFDEQVGPMIESVTNLGVRNVVLRKTRDLLLPRLISGELDVSELPIEVEARVE